MVYNMTFFYKVVTVVNLFCPINYLQKHISQADSVTITVEVVKHK